MRGPGCPGPETAPSPVPAGASLPGRRRRQMRECPDRAGSGRVCARGRVLSGRRPAGPDPGGAVGRGRWVVLGPAVRGMPGDRGGDRGRGHADVGRDAAGVAVHHRRGERPDRGPAVHAGRGPVRGRLPAGPGGGRARPGRSGDPPVVGLHAAGGGGGRAGRVRVPAAGRARSASARSTCTGTGPAR